ncbi:MAG: hypothetical protein SFX73_22300 [Kofleriaceae bacterium]|nr:hypothetical protein [Kofleriaceae bacterium]
MKNPLSLSLALALAVTGCAADARTNDGDGDGDGDGSGSGSGSQEPPAPEPKMQYSGGYRISSTFDLLTNMPGNSGSFLNGLVEATDDPDDPMSWLVDKMLEQMQPGTLKDVLTTAKPFVIGYLNDEVTNLAPELFDTLIQIGQNMEDVTKHMGLEEKLWVDVVDQSHVGKVTVDGLAFTIAGTTTKHMFADHDIDNVEATGVFVSLDAQSRFRIGQHTLPLPYGKIARVALDAAVIPAIDPSATSLGQLLSNAVNCQGVGQSIADALDIGSASFWAGACTGGLGLVANEVYEQLLDQDAILGLTIQGEARASDTDSDYKIDKLSLGEWDGTMNYSGEDATLADPATFIGSRIPSF